MSSNPIKTLSASFIKFNQLIENLVDYSQLKKIKVFKSCLVQFLTYLKCLHCFFYRIIPLTKSADGIYTMMSTKLCKPKSGY